MIKIAFNPKTGQMEVSRTTAAAELKKLKAEEKRSKPCVNCKKKGRPQKPPLRVK